MKQSQKQAETDYIRNNIKLRKCNNFKPETSDPNKCQCGYLLKEHSNESDTSQTNAFGEIAFQGSEDKVAKYVRVDSETDMKVIKTLMTEKWCMKPPNLLISVTGGAKSFELQYKLKIAFRRGLEKVARCTGAWIITGGNRAGVMKLVGEAVADYGLTAQGPVIAIGVAPWGRVQNRDQLEEESGDGKWPAKYPIPDKPESDEKTSYLDKNHTHFLLVDNGTQFKSSGTEIKFRADLEKEISTWKTETGSVVPVALLVLEGGSGTLTTVKEAVEKETPAIVFKTGNGSCGDILAYAVQNSTKLKAENGSTSYKVDQTVKGKLSEMLKKAFNARSNEETERWLGEVEDCVKMSDFISVYDLDATQETNSDIDDVIVKAVLRAKKSERLSTEKAAEKKDRLKLALALNCFDVAKSEIFPHDSPSLFQELLPDRCPHGRATGCGPLPLVGATIPGSTGDVSLMEDMMMTAIQLNRVEFVELFLENGFSLKDFCKEQRLLKLYNEAPKNCLLQTLPSKAKALKREFSFEDVKTLIEKLMGGNVLPKDKEMQRPSQDLMLWAVLMNQQDLAKLFWREPLAYPGEGERSEPQGVLTAAALVANGLLKAMKQFTTDTDEAQRLQEHANEFESLAIGVINECYKHDERRAHDLLTQPMDHWGEATCVQIAVLADNKRFISQTPCQSLLNTIWMGNMLHDNSLLKLVVSMLVFPLIFAIINFNEVQATVDIKKADKSILERKKLKRQPTKQLPIEATINQDEKKKSFGTAEKLYWFYTAPVVIFILNSLSYLIFLGLYSYIIVVQLSREYHITEGILVIWVFAIFLEEVRQLSTKSNQSVRLKLVTYITNTWNLLDVVTVFVFVVGMALRFVNNDSCFEAARVILSINLFTFFFRILHIFSVNKELGPKLVMMKEMVRNLMWFVVILMVFIMAYAIATEAILYPQTELSWKFLLYLPRRAYWHIFGELFLDDIENPDSCTNDPTKYNDYSEKRCPSDIGKYLVPVMTGIYVLITNVLLLNLLIAMFSYTFQLVQENTDIHWNFQRYNLVMEYYQRPWLPPPLIIFIHLYRTVRSCLQCETDRTSDSKNDLENQAEMRLMRWENIMADTYLKKIADSEAHSVENQVKGIMKRIEHLSSKIDAQVDGQGNTSESARTEVSNLEQQQQMGSMTEAISWIVEATKAIGMKCEVALPPMESQAPVYRNAEIRNQEAMLCNEPDLVTRL